jgi:16S rRNA C967 or C1407 C5-methylase (RsmB/RsmF family)/NOL1/NOP2/fmu family ribosome biogenesis protein
VTSIRINPSKVGVGLPVPGVDGLPGREEGVVLPSLSLAEKVPWSSFGYYLNERPSFTFDPLFHAGAYYVQEASSMFLEQALRQTADLSRPLRVLDLCAAPGGKSTLIQSLLSPESLLVSNEVIRTRVSVLQENMTKWGAANVIVTNNDPRDFQRLEDYFDVIVVDAPCSGSGLFRREPEAIGEWSAENVQICYQRQQRILADCWPALRQGGILIYSTCSYSKEEDEEILDWMQEELQAASCQLQVGADWNIVETMGKKGGYGYRFYPDKVKGEGFFLTCVRKEDGGMFAYPRNRKQVAEKLTRQEEERMKPWIRQEVPVFFFRHHEQVHALPAPLLEDLPYLQSFCYIKKAGILTGKPAAKEFIPEHELALSTLINKEIPAITVTKEQAIQYLRKEEVRAETELRGWALVQYEGQNLGWIKILPNRANNYYPKEWRILKRD